MNYESLSEAASLVTKLSPYRLLFSRHSWYVIGRSSVHREVRTFHVGRIQSLEPLDENRVRSLSKAICVTPGT
jgi:proteasome accessory factor B